MMKPNHFLIDAKQEKTDWSDHHQVDQSSEFLIRKKKQDYLVLNKYSNLRKLNSNRIEKFNDFFNNVNAINNYSNNDNRMDDAGCANATNHNNDFDLLKHVNLIKRPTAKRGNNLCKKLIKEFSRMDHLEIDEKKLDVNKSLVDQIIFWNKSEKNDNENSKNENCFSKIDNMLQGQEEETATVLLNSDATTPVEISNRINFADCKIRMNVFDKNTNITVAASNCINEYLIKIGASSVPNECFQHVSVQSKMFKQVNPTTNLNKSNINLNKQNNCLLRFEFLYDENFYWIVKIKKNLQQLISIEISAFHTAFVD